MNKTEVFYGWTAQSHLRVPPTHHIHFSPGGIPKHHQPGFGPECHGHQIIPKNMKKWHGNRLPILNSITWSFSPTHSRKSPVINIWKTVQKCCCYCWWEMNGRFPAATGRLLHEVFFQLILRLDFRKLSSPKITLVSLCVSSQIFFRWAGKLGLKLSRLNF